MWARVRDVVALLLLLASGAAIITGELALLFTGQWQMAITIAGLIGFWTAVQLGTHDPETPSAGAHAAGDDDGAEPTRADSRA